MEEMLLSFGEEAGRGVSTAYNHDSRRCVNYDVAPYITTVLNLSYYEVVPRHRTGRASVSVAFQVSPAKGMACRPSSRYFQSLINPMPIYPHPSLVQIMD